MSAFEEFGVMPEIIKAVEELEWTLPTDVQAEAIPLILGGGDVMAAAETGSGKTGAFAIPVLQITYETLRDMAVPKNSDPHAKVGSKITLSPDDRDNRFAVSEDGLLGQSRDEFNWAGCRGTVGVIKGKYYYEATVTDEGLCRVGWATKAASFDLGTDPHGYGFGGTGKKSNKRQFDTYGDSYGKGDTIGCFINCDQGTISFSKNGIDLGLAFEIPMRGFAFYPAICLKNAEMMLNFGTRPFKYNPGPYSGLADAPLANTTLGLASSSKKGRGPLAVILEPTRELAQQTHDNIILFAKYMPSPRIESLLLVGGTPLPPALDALKKGVDIITATPGKVWDLVQSGKVDLSDVRFFVLDEADRFLDSGDSEIIFKMYEGIPKTTQRLQVLMFSATLHSKEISTLSEKICKFPTWVDLKGKDSVPETVHHSMVWCDPAHDNSWVSSPVKPRTDGIHARDKQPFSTQGMSDVQYSQAVKLLKPHLLVKIIDAHKMDQALIFVRTRVDADNLESFLIEKGGGARRGIIEHPYSCSALHSGRSMKDRIANLEAFKNGDIKFLICTDVAARGIDVRELPYVINFTLPDKAEDYIHRVGRVGRADRMGLAISIVAKGKEKVWYHQCPSKGATCNDTRFVEEGGCSIWYDEPSYLQAIKTRLDQDIDLLAPDFTYAGGLVSFGQKRVKEGEESDVLLHLQQLSPLVKELAGLESSAQKQFWRLKSSFKS